MTVTMTSARIVYLGFVNFLSASYAMTAVFLDMDVDWLIAEMTFSCHSSSSAMTRFNR